MKISLENFGPVPDFTFDLDKSFNLIVGENNVGKSYAMTAVYLVIKALLTETEQFRFTYMISESLFDDDDQIEKTIENSKNKNSDINVSEIARTRVTRLLTEGIIASLSDSLESAFGELGNLKNFYSKKTLKIKITTPSLNIELIEDNGRLKVKKIDLPHKVYLRPVQQNRSRRLKDNVVYLYHNKQNEEHFEDEFNRYTSSLVLSLISEVLKGARTIHYLPASRSGLYQALTAFGAIMAQLSQSRSFLNKKIEIPGIPEHLSDYFLKLTEISKRSRFDPQKVREIADELEREVLKGQVDFDTSDKKITYKPDDSDQVLDLTSTSSMVSELAPIVSYIRYVLTAPRRRNTGFITRHRSLSSPRKENPALLIIEEPEAHLHPKVQLQLADIFVKLSQRGVKIVITSHSNYIFNRISNAIIKHDLSPEDVSATIFRSESSHVNKARELTIDDLGIVDENFVEVTDTLLDEREDALNNMNDSI